MTLAIVTPAPGSRSAHKLSQQIIAESERETPDYNLIGSGLRQLIDERNEYLKEHSARPCFNGVLMWFDNKCKFVSSVELFASHPVPNIKMPEMLVQEHAPSA